MTWSAGSGDEVDVYARVREGAAWVDIGGSTVGRGVSNSVTESREPDVAWLNGQLFIAYRERIGRHRADLRQDVRRRRVGERRPRRRGEAGRQRHHRAARWIRSSKSGGGELFLAWVDHDHADYADPHARIYAKRWDGTAFVETLPGDASGGGISATGGKLSALDSPVDANGRPTVGWTDDSSGLPQAYLRTVTQLPGKVFVANATRQRAGHPRCQRSRRGRRHRARTGRPRRLHARQPTTRACTILGAQGGGSVVTGAVSGERRRRAAAAEPRARA